MTRMDVDIQKAFGRANDLSNPLLKMQRQKDVDYKGLLVLKSL